MQLHELKPGEIGVGISKKTIVWAPVPHAIKHRDGEIRPKIPNPGLHFYKW